MASSRVLAVCAAGLALVGTLVLAAWVARPACALVLSPTVVAEPITGQWMIERGEKAGTIRLTLQRSQGTRSHMSSTDEYEASAVRGLDWRQADSPAGGAVRFQIVRDAGTFECEGWFRQGRGSGHFTFVPDAGFVSEMRGLGYDDLSDEHVFTLAVHDVSRALVREYASLGYEKIPYNDLVAMRIHGVAPQYIRELGSLGYEKVPIHTLVAMRIHGVTPAAIRDLKALGYDQIDTEMLISMRIHGATPQFVQELQAEGYSAVPAQQLVAMRIHGVTPEFIKRLKERGYSNVSVEELISMRIHGVAR